MIVGPSRQELAEFGEPSDELIGALAATVVCLGHHGFDNASAYVDAMTGDDTVRAHNLLVEVDELLRERWEKQGAPNPRLLRSNGDAYSR